MSIYPLYLPSIRKAWYATNRYYGNTLRNVQAMIQSYEEHIERKYY
jgi:hypothetical protein